MVFGEVASRNILRSVGRRFKMARNTATNAAKHAADVFNEFTHDFLLVRALGHVPRELADLLRVQVGVVGAGEAPALVVELLRVLAAGPQAEVPVFALRRAGEDGASVFVHQRGAEGEVPRVFADLAAFVDPEEVEAFAAEAVGVVGAFEPEFAVADEGDAVFAAVHVDDELLGEVEEHFFPLFLRVPVGGGDAEDDRVLRGQGGLADGFVGAAFGFAPASAAGEEPKPGWTRVELLLSGVGLVPDREL